MLDDYAGHPGNRGQPLFTQAQIDPAVIVADRLGFQVAVHSIGDAGVRRTLDAYAAARAANGPRDSRHRVEHIEDQPRRHPALEQRVVASMQPLHAPGRSATRPRRHGAWRGRSATSCRGPGHAAWR